MSIKNRLAEIQVKYSTKIKKEDRVQVKSSEDAFRVLIEYEKKRLIDTG